jgi:PST family polysaccharide transporter
MTAFGGAALRQADPETAGSLDRGLGREKLSRAFGRSVRNNLFAELGVQAVRIGGFVVLARLLTPADFGLLRVLVAISLIATMLNAVGIPEALIQRPELTATHEATAWWVSVAMGWATALGLYCGAPLIARLMAMPGLIPGVRLLSLPIMFGGTTAVASARLRRRFQFGTIAAADVAAELGFLAVALGLIAFGERSWSLAGGLAARVAIQAGVLAMVERYVPRVLPSRAALRDLAGFSATVLGARLLTALAGNADYLLVGRLLGSQALGFYGMAWDLLRFIPDRLYSVAGRVTLPAFCALQHDRAGMARAYSDFTNYIALLILPLVTCAALAAPRLIGLIYGPQWIPAAAPMRLLAGGLMLLGLRMAIGSVYFAHGRPSFDLYVHALRLALIVAVVAVSAPYGLIAVSAGMGLVEAIVSIAGQMLASRLLELRLRVTLAAAWPGARVAAFCVTAMVAAEWLDGTLKLGPTAGLPMVVVLPGLAFIALERSTLRRLLAGRPGPRRTPALALEG